MPGPPQDVLGVCGARLYIGDDHGDNCATMRCAEPSGHEPPHREVFERGDRQRVEVTWTEDERSECVECKQRFDETNRCDTCERALCEACFGRIPDSCETCFGIYCSRCEPGHTCEPYEKGLI